MFRRTVDAPDGRKWTIGRRWMPRRPRLGRVKVGSGGLDVPDLGIGLDDLGVFGAILAAIALAIVTVFLLLVLFNVVAIALELMIVLFLLFAGVFGRVVLRRPWTVEARAGGEAHAWPVVGWRASAAKIDEVAERVRSGAELDAPRRHR